MLKSFFAAAAAVLEKFLCFSFVAVAKVLQLKVSFVMMIIDFTATSCTAGFISSQFFFSVSLFEKKLNVRRKNNSLITYSFIVIQLEFNGIYV